MVIVSFTLWGNQMQIATIPNLPLFTIPEDYDTINRLTFSLEPFEVERMGNDENGFTIYRCEGMGYDFYMTSEVHDGSLWILEN